MKTNDHQPAAVGAIGHVDVYPNSRNVIPGKVVFTVDFRSPDQATLDRMKAIDPTAQPKASSEGPKRKAGDLVFLDVKFDDKPKPGAPRKSVNARAVPDKPASNNGAPNVPPVQRAPEVALRRKCLMSTSWLTGSRRNKE